MCNDHVSDQSDNTRQTVRDGYAEIAIGGKGCCGCSDPQQLAEAIGYSRQELESLPEGANMGLSCGNPTTIADLRQGQVVLDLGCGGGFDVFIAAKKVGPTGRAIGVDMTPEMIGKARAGIPEFKRKTGLSNVEFRLGEIEYIPAADASVDVVISNCVVNLSSDKEQVWREIARVLTKGGKACISDIALKKPLPQKLLESAAAIVGCVAGAVHIEDTINMAKQTGLKNIKVLEKPYNIDAMADCNDPLYKQIHEFLPPGSGLSDYIVSADVTASKK